MSPLTVKDWKDYDPVTQVGDPSTPMTSAALEDMESRVGAYTDSRSPHCMDAADVGLLAWGYDAAPATAASTPVAGTAYWTRLPIRETQTWNRVVMAISTPGTGAQPLVNCFLGLYDMTGQRRGLSADQSGAWATGGTKAATLTADSGQTLTMTPADQWAYVAFVVGTQATTPVQLFRSGSSSAPGQLLLSAATSPPARFLTKAGFAAGLPTSIDYTTCAISSILWWKGVAA